MWLEMAFWWHFGQKKGIVKGKWGGGGCKTKMTPKQHQNEHQNFFF